MNKPLYVLYKKRLLLSELFEVKIASYETNARIVFQQEPESYLNLFKDKKGKSGCYYSEYHEAYFSYDLNQIKKQIGYLKGDYSKGLELICKYEAEHNLL